LQQNSKALRVYPSSVVIWQTEASMTNDQTMMKRSR
jgi:hypothetical protein